MNPFLRLLLHFKTSFLRLMSLLFMNNPIGFTFSSHASSAVPLHQRVILGDWQAKNRGICTAEAVA